MKPTKKRKPRKRKPEAPKNLGGRPTEYDPRIHPKIVRELCKTYGSIDKTACKILGVSIPTFYSWKKSHPEFLAALREGKELYDSDKVESTCLRMALGYERDNKRTETLKDGTKKEITFTNYYAPSIEAIKFWLRNRSPQRWPDNRNISATGEVGLNIGLTDADLGALGRKELEQLKRILSKVAKSQAT